MDNSLAGLFGGFREGESMRPFGLFPFPYQMLPETWREIIGARELVIIMLCEFGFGEEVIAFLEFSNETFEVGIGQEGKQYILLYQGANREDASLAFIEAIN